MSTELQRKTPIIMQGPSVRAIQDGTKTQTRRVITRRNSLVNGASWPRGAWNLLDFSSPHVFVDSGPSPAGNAGPYLKVPRPDNQTVHRVYPRVLPGHQFWVKEAVQAWMYIDDEQACVEYSADGHIHDDAEWVWKRDSLPAMFMPRGLSRITLRVTATRPQKLQDISETDALAEGCHDSDGAPTQELSGTARGAYALVWDEINAKRGAPWSSNPWVWAYTFEREGSQ